MSDGSFEIVEVVPHDGQKLDLVARFLRTHSPPGFPPITAAAANLQLDMQGGRLYVIAAMAERQVIGHISLCVRQEFCGKTGYASLLLVHPERREKGIAKQLMRRLIDRARFVNVTAIECYCGPDRPLARRLIESLGFRLEAPSDRHWKLDLQPRR
jgi:GNAT superfamily N-acetyltransferase